MDPREEPRRPLVFILVPMLLTFAIQRTFLHFFSHPNFHVYVGGFRVHHLFSGALLLVSSSFLLAFGTRARSLVLASLGVGSAMVLDEVFFLVFTDGSNEAYRGRISFQVDRLEASVETFLLTLYARARRR